jgi:catechol 2,3-dioxygenase-like lactoylglutathione lyase family enzyme
VSLGHSWELTIHTGDIERSLAFYDSLGFRRLPDGRTTDGVITLALAPGPTPYSRLTYLADESGEKLRDPGGLEIAVVKAPRADAVDRTPVSRCGRFGEISILSPDLAKSEEFWTGLGFTVRMRPKMENTFLSLSDGVVNIGLYRREVCPHAFQSPVVTYFEDDMAQRVRALKGDGFRFLEELPGRDGAVAHGVAQAPEGQMLFLFGTE